MKRWRAVAKGEEVNVNATMAALTLDIIGLSGFGYNFNALDDPHSEIRGAYGVCMCMCMCICVRVCVCFPP